MLSAEDRIKFAYTPVAGMLGNDLAQLMSGVDYGGVEVRGFDSADQAAGTVKDGIQILGILDNTLKMKYS